MLYRIVLLLFVPICCLAVDQKAGFFVAAPPEVPREEDVFFAEMPLSEMYGMKPSVDTSEDFSFDFSLSGLEKELEKLDKMEINPDWEKKANELLERGEELEQKAAEKIQEWYEKATTTTLDWLQDASGVMATVGGGVTVVGGTVWGVYKVLKRTPTSIRNAAGRALERTSSSERIVLVDRPPEVSRSSKPVGRVTR